MEETSIEPSPSVEATLQPSQPLQEETLLRWYATAVSFFGLLLMTSTWKLWVPVSSFPQVPLISWMRDIPRWVDDGLFAAIMVTLFSILVTTLFNRWQKLSQAGWLLFAISMIGAMFINQHRIQTWAFQFLVIAILYLTIIRRSRLVALRAFVLCIYVSSAASKLDISFVNGQGKWLVEGLMTSIGLSTTYWSQSRMQTLAWMMPISELVVAILLIFSRLGRWRILPALGMHILLLLTFSPWGHHQNNGVLLWNGFFIVQAILLFGINTAEKPASIDNILKDKKRPWGHQIGKYFLISLMILPAFERSGRFDTWTSWAVYAGHPEEVFIEVNETALQKLPPELMKLAQKRYALQEDYYRLRIDRWALQSVNAPIYPESRFRIGVALSLAKRYHLKDGIRIRFRSTADRFSGERTETIYNGIQEIKNFANTFSLNSDPRH